MSKLNLLTITKLAVFATIPFFLFSCADEGNRNDNEQVEADKKQEDNKNSKLLEIDGKVFSIPSPIQTAFLLKNSGAAYSSELLNETSKVANYATTDKKALNLGIYGADMGYATIYDQTQDAISYMAVTKRLSSELGMTNIFNESMLKRFEANLGNQDSLLSLVSDAFKSADGYLKTNKQNDISVLLLAGGWIETLHFATNLAKSTDNQTIKNRIGEQKITIKNLINILLPYQGKPAIAEILNKLNELSDLYGNIEYKYTFHSPVTDSDAKLTTIKSTSEIVMSPEQLNDIIRKVEEIRNSIIN